MKIKKTILTGALILLEICLMLVIIWRLNSEAIDIYGAMEVISVIVVVLLIYSRDNPSYKLTWVVIILVFPMFGVFIYLLAGTHYLSPKLRRAIKSSRKFNKLTRYQKPQILDELRHHGGIYLKQAQFILKLADKPVYKGTQAHLLTPGENLQKVLLDELENAKKFIFIEFFIIAESIMWDDIFEILRRKAAEGIEVRIIYDDAGSMDRLPHDFRQVCGHAGIHTAAFNPFTPMLNKFMEYRDHRKIVVIDGNTGFTGGINVGDEYTNKLKRFGHWKDAGLVLYGDAVWNLTVMFLDMWILMTGERLFYNRYHTTKSAKDDGFVQPFNDSPFSGNVSEGAYMQIINSSCRYVYIMTPYLILDHEMTITLCNAARGGIDVRIITPFVPDKKFVHIVTRGYYGQLMECGVKIYEYTPGFLHAKMALCDDEIGIIGSVNMDYRSFYLQFEDAVLLYGCTMLKEMKEDFAQTLAKSKLIDPLDWKKRHLREKVAEIFLRLFAPLM
jgi:cardiolipin synthase